MKSPPDERRLDIAAFAADGARLQGQWALRDLARVIEDEPPQTADLRGDVSWSASGEQRAVPGSAPELWLHVSVQARLHRTCQRCLEPVALPMALERSFRFVRGEAAAATLDAEIEDDVLELSRQFDLRELVEDELLLGLPVVPRHDVCPVPLAAPLDADTTVADEPVQRPFATLATLKRPPAG